MRTPRSRRPPPQDKHHRERYGPNSPVRGIRHSRPRKFCSSIWEVSCSPGPHSHANPMPQTARSSVGAAREQLLRALTADHDDCVWVTANLIWDDLAMTHFGNDVQRRRSTLAANSSAARVTPR